MGISVNLLDPDLGIQTVLDTADDTGMPGARPLASTVLCETGLDELYNRGAAAKLLDAALCPPVGDGWLLQPENFLAELKGSMKALQSSRDPAVRAFVRDELTPLLENTELFKAYSNLMVGG